MIKYIRKEHIFIALMVTLTLMSFFFFITRDAISAPELDWEKITLIDSEGEQIPLSEFMDKPLIINLWATWCKPCVKEMPAMTVAGKELEKEGIQLIAISDESARFVSGFIEKHKLTLPIFRYEGRFKSLGISGLPTTYLLKPGGKMVFSQVGVLDWEDPAFLEKLRTLLSAK